MEQSGGADEPIDRRVFELVDGRLVEFVGAAAPDGAETVAGRGRCAGAGVATITLDRPEALNALTVPMKVALLAALRRVARDRAVRAVVLTGAGRAFCAGQDLSERARARCRAARGRAPRALQPDHPGDARLDQPIVGAINGVAAGAGASIAFACDIRLAAEAACFVLAFGRIGWSRTAARRGSCRGCRPGASGRAGTVGEPCRRSTRERFGLVARVVPDDALAGEARALAALAAGAPMALAQTKRRSSGAGRSTSRRPSRTRPIPGDRRRHGRPRRGPRGVPREAAAAVHRGVAVRAAVPAGWRVSPADLDPRTCRRLLPNDR